MAGWWARVGAGTEQIEASILARLSAPKQSRGQSLTHCAECEEPIPHARRRAIPGVKLCIHCQQERDQIFTQNGGINRRGCKDSQLK
jgi:phage/conjugal plasmid C-4 type zinc finger TraR family protein